MKRQSRVHLLRALYALIVAFLVLGQTAMTAAASTGPAGTHTIPRFQDTVSFSLYTVVQSTEVEPPPDDWFLHQMILDQLNIDVDFQWLATGDDYNTVLQTRAAANDLPDLFRINAASVPVLNQQGLLADWTPFLDDMPEFVKQRNVEALKPVGTYDGKLVTLTEQSPNPFKGIVAIRQDWLDKLGLEVPTTTDEFLNVMKAFTTQDPDGNGQNDTYGWSGSIDSQGTIGGFDPIYGAFGALGDWQLANNQLTPMVTTDNRKQALDFINQMNQAGVIDPDWSSQTGQDFQTKWKSGRVGIFFNDWCATFCLQGYGEFVRANPTGMLTVIAPPTGPDGASATATTSQVGTQYGMSQAAASDERGEAIARFLEWITTDGYEATAFGRLDQDYHKAADGTITQEIQPEHLIQRQLCGWAYKGTPEELKARYGTVTDYDNGQTVDVYSVLEKAASLPKTDITQFAPLPPYPAEVSADLQRTINEGQFAFASGTQPIDEWDAFVQSLSDVGLQSWVDQATARAKEIGLITA